MTSNSWQRNLAACFVAELLAMSAFTFVDPLLPLYIQEVGSLTSAQAAFWAGIAASGLGISMFFVSPFWGILADRVGRKPMVMRAMFGGAFVLSLIAIAPNIYIIVGLRWLQGVLTGSVAAATALASGIAPRDRMSFAMGIIMLAVFGGQTIGPLIGGFVADHYGYQATFFMSGAFLVMGGLVLLTMVQENFQKPPQTERRAFKDLLNFSAYKNMLPLLTVMCLVSVGQSLVGPITSLRIKEIDVSGRTASITGIIFSLVGLAAATSSLISGRLGSRVSLVKIMTISCLAIGVLYLPPVWAGTVLLLAASLVLSGLFRGGLATSQNALIGYSVSRDQQGIAYGLAQSASSLGGGAGSIIGGSLAGAIGLKNIFAVSAGVLILAGILTAKWLPRTKKETEQSAG